MSVWAGVAKVAGETFNMLYNAQRENQRQGWEKQVYADQKVREDSRYQRAVTDAKAAGLHPLFALGAAGAGRTVSFGGGRTGSYAGRGLARIGSAIGDTIQREEAKPAENLRTAQSNELHNLEVQQRQRNIAHSDQTLADMKYDSDMKRTEQRELYWGDSDPGITGAQTPGDGTKLYAYDKAPPGLELRPTQAEAKTSRPLMGEVIGSDGYRYQIIDPKTGDEISQWHLLAMIILRHTGKARRFASRETMRQAENIARGIKRKMRSGRTSPKRKRIRGR